MLVQIILLFYVQNIINSCVLQKPYYDLELAEEYFELFLFVHKRSYVNDKNKKQIKLETFKNNLNIINQKNEAEPYAVFDINRYADMSKEEFRKFYSTDTAEKNTEPKEISKDYPKCKIFNDSDVHTHDAPDEFDWRTRNAVGIVKDQGSCGSCWAFSATGNVEGQYAIKTGKIVSLSEQQLLDCDTQSEGCKGGAITKAMSYLIEKGGQISDKDYKYEASTETCRFNSSKVVAKVVDCQAYKLTDEEKTKELLYKIGPLAIAMDSYDFMFYKQGILTNCTFEEFDHGVVLVGYGTDNGVPFWNIKNGWSANWGEQGFIRVKRGVNACGFLKHVHVTAILDN